MASLASTTSPSSNEKAVPDEFSYQGPVGGVGGAEFHDQLPKSDGAAPRIHAIAVWANDLHVVAIQTTYEVRATTSAPPSIVPGKKWGGNTFQAFLKRMGGDGRTKMGYFEFDADEHLVAIDAYSRTTGASLRIDNVNNMIVGGIRIITNKNVFPWVKNEPKEEKVLRLVVPDGYAFFGFFGRYWWLLDAVGLSCVRKEGSVTTLPRAASEREEVAGAGNSEETEENRHRASSSYKNPPGRWDFFISYTQRNPISVALGEKLSSTLVAYGKRVWFDVNMDDKSEDAMQEGVENASCVIAIISGPTLEANDEDGSKGRKNAYFSRSFCLKELRWARAKNVPILPVVSDDDKKHISELLATVPEDLRSLGSEDFVDLHRTDKEYWDVGIKKILRRNSSVPS